MKRNSDHTYNPVAVELIPSSSILLNQAERAA